MSSLHLKLVPIARRPNRNLMGSLPGVSQVFGSLSLQTCSRPFPGLPSAEGDRKVLAGSWKAARLPPDQVQVMERCFHDSQDRITCNHHRHLLFPPTNLGPEAHSLESHSFFFSASVILSPTSLSGFASSAAPFLNEAEVLAG